MDKVRESNIKSTASYRKLNSEKVKESNRNSTASYRKSNPEKVKKSCDKATAIYRLSKPKELADSFKNSSRTYYQKYPERVQNIQKRKYMKRKLACNDSEHENESKKLRISSLDNSFETSGYPRCPMSISKATEIFHKNISVGPEYICTCCDQLWYRSSVSKCNASLYQSCSREILDLCLTGLKSIDNTEWICGTCHSNLKAGKLPTCAKANKMTFPEKPDVLKDLTPLEERLISPRIPFMQVRELPSGGQLSIHGNVVNVPADVNSTVSVLPRPVNESQTIPIKLKRRLGYKHHYQFQNIVTTTSFTVVRFTLIARSSRSSKGIPNLCICIRQSHAFNATDQYPNTFLLLYNFDSKHFSTHRINYVNNQQTVSKLWTTELCTD